MEILKKLILIIGVLTIIIVVGNAFVSILKSTEVLIRMVPWYVSSPLMMTVIYTVQIIDFRKLF